MQAEHACVLVQSATLLIRSSTTAMGSTSKNSTAGSASIVRLDLWWRQSAARRRGGGRGRPTHPPSSQRWCLRRPSPVVWLRPARRVETAGRCPDTPRCRRGGWCMRLREPRCARTPGACYLLMPPFCERAPIPMGTVDSQVAQSTSHCVGVHHERAWPTLFALTVSKIDSHNRAPDHP